MSQRPRPAPENLRINDGDTVVFMGDSITDAGWRQDQRRSLGGGYVALVADFLAARYPERDIRILNRGISGNRVVDLTERWETDVISLQPNWVSVSIGINDVWRKFDGRPELHIPVEEYAIHYRRLLDWTREKTTAQLILMETSVIGENPDAEPNQVLKPYNEAIRRFTDEYDAILVPIFEAFHRGMSSRPGFAWTGDGVHPFPSGHMLMAVTWLQAVGATF